MRMLEEGRPITLSKALLCFMYEKVQASIFPNPQFTENMASAYLLHRIVLTHEVRNIGEDVVLNLTAYILIRVDSPSVAQTIDTHMADFPVVCANYDVTGTVLEGLVKPYVVLNRNGMKIGVFGLSPKMEGLVQADKCEGIVYNDPIAVAQKIADRLRTKEGCDVVVCLSHLGFRIKNGVCDEKLAAETKGVDVILGGHSHTFMEKPAFFLNAEGKSIPVLHTGKNGIFVGELDLTLSEEE